MAGILPEVLKEKKGMSMKLPALAIILLSACSSVTAPVDNELAYLRPRQAFGCAALGGYGIDLVMSEEQRAEVLEGITRWNETHPDALVTAHDINVSDPKEQCLVTLANAAAADSIGVGGAFTYSVKSQRLTIDLGCRGLCPVARVYAGLGFMHGDDWSTIDARWPAVEDCTAGVGC